MGQPRPGLRVGDHLGTAGAPEQSLKLVASLAKCLLGPRVQEFFRLHSAGYVGKKGPYPFAVLFRELPTEQKDKLIEEPSAGRTHWPNKLRRQPEWYRNDLQAGPLDSKVGGKESTNGLRFNCNRQRFPVIGVRTLRQMAGCLFPPARRHLRIKAASGVMAFAVALIATREGA